MNPAPSLFQTARALIVRDVQLLWRRRGDALQPALFALLVVVLFALGLGTSPQALSKVAPAVLWVAVLLAGLLSLDTLFRGDAEDGSLEQWILAPVPLAWLVGPVAIGGCIYLFLSLPFTTQKWFLIWNAVGLVVYLLYSRRNAVLGHR